MRMPRARDAACSVLSAQTHGVDGIGPDPALPLLVVQVSPNSTTRDLCETASGRWQLVFGSLPQKKLSEAGRAKARKLVIYLS
jgi:hypothetical protein